MGACCSSDAGAATSTNTARQLRKDPYKIPTPVYEPTATAPSSSTTNPADSSSPARIEPHSTKKPTKKTTPAESTPSSSQPGAVAVRYDEEPTTTAPPSHKNKKKTPTIASLPPPTPVRVHKGQDVFLTYKKGKDLGVGAFATVFVGTHRSTRIDYAIKKINVTKMQWGDRDALQDEISNLTEVKNGPHICQLIEVYSPNKRDCYLVMEWCQGGELFDRILEKRTFTEKEARNVVKGVLSALQYMHSKRIAHRDLKPENLLLVSKESDTDIKLADFGFARKVHEYNGCRTLCGTPGYLAPEILERFPAYDTKCDLWSAGVILFVLLSGYLPFDDENEDAVFDRTRNGQYEFYPDYWREVSTSAKNLVISLLTVNPSKRMSANHALRHDWMQQGDAILAKRTLSVARLRQSIVEGRAQENKPAPTTEAATPENRLKHLNDAFNSYITKCDDDTATVFTAVTKPEQRRVVEDSAKGLPFKHFYKVGETLGEGGFGVVKRADHKKTHESRAVKIVDRTRLEEHGKESLKDEISALKLLRGGPHIVRLIDVFEEQQYTYIIMEEMTGGELLRRIVDKEVYTEREARSVCKILFSAVDYIHKKKIAHRDLKPENLLLQNADDDTSIKIADFGFAKKVRKPNCLSTLCGSASYVAPEVLDLTSRGYDQRADLWSCGVIMYVLLGGYAPFEGPVDQLANLILQGKYEFHDQYWMYTSSSAKDLIESCLQVDPNDRITAEQALMSDWMTTEAETLTGNDLSVAQEQIRKTLPIEKLKGAIYTVMLTNKLTSLGESFTSTLGDTNTIQQRQQAVNLPSTVPEVASIPSEATASGQLFYEQYDLGGAFGEGTFSVVHEAVQKFSMEEVAVKVVDRRGLHPADAVALQDEIIALKEVAGCPHIVELYDVFEEPDTTFLVMEKMRGGDLIERIVAKAHYTEADAKAVCRNLLLGVQYCHSKSIANRNLKPENLLLSEKDNDISVKISDFGYAKKVHYPNSLRTQCGTEGYTAPEILGHRPEYDVMCDMWSLGVVMYILVGGYRPFRGTGTEIMRQIRYGEYEFHDRYWSHVSKEAKDLIRQMMTVDPNKRISAPQALESDWIVADNSTLMSDLTGNQTELRTFKGKAKMRQVVQMMIAMDKLQGLAESYRSFNEGIEMVYDA